MPYPGKQACRRSAFPRTAGTVGNRSPRNVHWQLSNSEFVERLTVTRSTSGNSPRACVGTTQGATTVGPSPRNRENGLPLAGWPQTPNDLRKVLDLTLLGYPMKHPASIDAGCPEKRAKGVEPSADPRKPSGNVGIVNAGAPKALPTLCPPVAVDAELGDIVAAWPDLPAILRAGIVAMVRAATQR